MPTNIRIPNASGHIEITKADATVITLTTGDKYVPADIDVVVRPQVGSFNNVSTQGVTYSENEDTNTIIPANGYLYLNKGWFDDTKISLGHLIPDDTTLPNAGSDKILQGFEAYDTNGNKLVGTIATITPLFDGGDVTVTPTASVVTKPSATIQPDGTFVKMDAPTGGTNLYGAYYGVTTSNTGMAEDTYLWVDGTISRVKGLAEAKASATMADVLYNGNTTGFVDKPDDTVAFAGGTTTSTTEDTEDIDVDLTDNFSKYYIPIVSVHATGGTVTQGTGSGTVTGTSPALNVTQTGSFVTNASSYGITNNASEVSGSTDGTDYLTIDVLASQSQTAQTWSGTATIPWTKTAVKQEGTIAGAIHLENGSQIMPSDGGDFTATISGNVTATLGTHTPYYIKIVHPHGAGGGVTLNDGSSTTTADLHAVANLTQTGTFTTASSFGVEHNTTQTGTDGTDYLTITESATATATVKPNQTATLAYTRAAITSDGAYQGAVNIASGDQLFESSTGSLQKTITTGNTVDEEIIGDGFWTIPIVTPTLSGGALTADSTPISMSIGNNGTFEVNPNVVLKRQQSTGSDWDTPITKSDYNIVDEGDASLSDNDKKWIKIDAGATATGNVTVSGSITVSRGAVSITTDPGATNQTLCNASTMAAASETYSGTQDVPITDSIVNEGTDLYVREVTALLTNTATASITAQPNVNGTATAVYHTSASDTTGTALTLPATNTTTGYVEFDVTQSLTNAQNAKANADATATQTKGLTKGNTSYANQHSVNIVPTYTTTKVRMNVYGGGYAVDGTTIA